MCRARTPGTDSFLALLSHSLHSLDIPERADGRGTRAINGCLTKLCIRHHIFSAREVDLRLFHFDEPDWYGRLDWVMRPRRDAAVSYAIEIDSTNKRRSLDKLLKAYRLQYNSVWIRWNSPIELEIPDEIMLLDLTCSSPQNHKSFIKRENDGRSWNQERDHELVACFKTGAGAREIASRIKRTPGAVRARLVRLGLIAERKELQS